MRSNKTRGDPLIWAGYFLLGIAFVVSLLVSISAPAVQVFDVTRTTFSSSVVNNATSEPADQFRLGIWGYCQRQTLDGKITCQKGGFGYELQVRDSAGHIEYISSKWIKVLKVLQLSSTFNVFTSNMIGIFNRGALLPSMFISSFGVSLPVIISIALYRNQQSKLDNFIVFGDTDLGPGFWMNLSALLTLLLACSLVYFGEHLTIKKLRASLRQHDHA